MERLDTTCTGRLFAAWAAYALAATVVWQFVRTHGLPESTAWAVAGLMAVAVLVWTREI